MAYRWETRDSVWWEDENSGRFALAGSKGLSQIDWPALARQRLPDVAQLLGAALPGACKHADMYPDMYSDIYPEDFAYCPTCGLALQRATPGAPPAWWGATSAALAADPLPKHVPHGLPISALALAGALESRAAEPAVGHADVRMPKPPNVPCVFAAANYGFAVQRLLALAYGRDVLQYWDPASAGWQVFSAEEGAADLEFTVSDYAWLPATRVRRGEVALLPSRRGLVRLFINPIADSYHTETVFEADLASAPGAVLRRIACLFIADGAVQLWSAKADGSDPAIFACAGALPASGWSAPLSYDDSLLWLHADGHLIWQPGGAPQWLPWPPGWRPRLNFGGATQSRDGRLWLIGHDGRSYCFLELGKENGQLERIDGARLGFGKLLFRRGHPVKSDPWDSEDVEDHKQADTLVLPLLQNFISGRDEPTGLVLRIARYTGTAEAALDGAALGNKVLIEWIGARNVILDEVVGIASPADCVALVYDDHLWLHHPKWNEMRGWRLKAAS
ncbi:hypothetical protein AAKU55_002792 [Oxalobacteraceae bacterium GrIS 1.11]